MGNTTIGVKIDEVTQERIKTAAQRLNRTPHWVIKQAIFNYLAQLESDHFIPEELSDPREEHRDNIESPTIIVEKKSSPFLDFAQQILPQSAFRAAITAVYRCPESAAVSMLLERARMPTPLVQATHQMAYQLAAKLRHQKRTYERAGIVQNLLQEFSLSSQEGIALMCLSEALLRIPDKTTRDVLIRDKISRGNWRSHLGHSPSLFVNAATWGLLLTGRLMVTHNETHLSGTLHRIIGKRGEPLIRKGVDMVMRLMGEQFVSGETIDAALTHSRKWEAKGFSYSYDMLGEAALTEQDVQRYLQAYQQAIQAIGKASNGRGIYDGPGISLKLSALHPRYHRTQYDRVMNELYPKLLSLTQLARYYDISINIDAEESERLELSLDLLERLCFEPTLAGWNGIGVAIQAYQKRCLKVIEALIDLAQRSQHRLMVRLVKGAYWDSEIKRTQVEGLEDYPVYTRKIYTDISYLACARQLLSMAHAIYPQFATHNAQTLSAIYHIAGTDYYSGQYEFQCLHGMGEPLYEQVVGKVAAGKLNRPCRIYAPVGAHKTLLSYLVRRLLENGSNTSFVNQVADQNYPLDKLVADPIIEVEAIAAAEGSLGSPHPLIPLPRALYGKARPNSCGLDLSNEQHLASLSSTLLNAPPQLYHARPLIAEMSTSQLEPQPVFNPAQSQDILGYVIPTSEQDLENALNSAVMAGMGWFATPVQQRAELLEKTAELLENQRQALMGLLIREAGKTFNNAISEIREAIDFLYYYAQQIRQTFSNDTHRPLGPVVCISPWNFPLAIFMGQISAALAAGNTVLAKPAEQTSLIAAQAVHLLLEAGIPPGVVQLLPGEGKTVGVKLISDHRVRGVMFTGSTTVAAQIQRHLAKRLDPRGYPIPLIAETGGLNAMIVDSSALAEQVVVDVITSAFDSAGQRCSALRILCIQEEVADHILKMLRGAMAQYRMGNPERFAIDIGPLIDSKAKNHIEQYLQTIRTKGYPIYQAVFEHPQDAHEWQQGNFVKPTLIELNHFSELEHEIFGPVLHVVRYQRQELDTLIRQINTSGYGLTLGLHTRIDETIAQVTKQAKVGNQYVNRNMVGAIVGVQPFGGEGLSGTGPKAGGPFYLYRLLSQRPVNTSQLIFAGQLQDESFPPIQQGASQALLTWAKQENLNNITQQITQFAHGSPSGKVYLLTGPTGERNSYALLPRERILCLFDNQQDALIQLAAVLAVGSQVLWIDHELARKLYHRLPSLVQQHIQFVIAWNSPNSHFDAVIYHGDSDQLGVLCQEIAERPGSLVSVQGFARGETHILLECLLLERSLSINTTAAGGNANLMTIN